MTLGTTSVKMNFSSVLGRGTVLPVTSLLRLLISKVGFPADRQPNTLQNYHALSATQIQCPTRDKLESDKRNLRIDSQSLVQLYPWLTTARKTVYPTMISHVLDLRIRDRLESMLHCAFGIQICFTQCIASPYSSRVVRGLIAFCCMIWDLAGKSSSSIELLYPTVL